MSTCISTDRTEPFPFHKFGTTAKEVLENFSRKELLSNSTVLTTAAFKRPNEATYQNKRYRALHKMLGFSSRISS